MFKEKSIPLAETEKKEEKERKLNPKEIEGMGKDMGQYVEELRSGIEEIKQELKTEKDKQKIKELQAALKKWQTEYDGLKDFVAVIEEGDCEEIIKKPYKG